MGRHSRHSLYAANTLRLRACFASKAAPPSRKDPRCSVHISLSVFMFRRKCRKPEVQEDGGAGPRSFPAARHDATNRTKVLRERAAPTGKVCPCWMASSRSAARCFAVSPCDSALPPHYWSRSVSGTGHDKSPDPQACRDAHPRRFLSTPSEPWQTKSRTWCAPAGQ
jgi:hypothetical protein